MPPAPQRHKRPKKKKKAKTNKRSSSSMADHHRHGESDGDQHNSLHQVVMDNMEGSSSGYESVTTDRTQMAAEVKPAKIETDKRSNLTEQAIIEIEKAAMIEPDTVADYLSQPFESSPEKGTQEVEDLGFKTPPSVDPSIPVDQSLVEVASKLDNDANIQEKDDSVAADTRLEVEHTVINETDAENTQLSKENEAQKLDSTTDKTSPKSQQDSLQDSANDRCQHCGRSDDDHVNEPVIPDCSEKQPLLASAPQLPEKASWKNCCGIFELCSGSNRN
ncbi:hypothetical protein R6Q59_002474 [Mikania micrantha]|uniref:Uncharacterized protein n=1 Tax=Mikania micrantha TaxID=192012 RepID=A0A5N6NQT1_9ASTR|nr:hypothetical protein E3N88_19511 [Mikania micrantha]